MINNIPGQLAFADKINLWYTIKEYLNQRRTADGNYIQAFLPMTFVLDDENEVNEFLRCTRSEFVFTKDFIVLKSDDMFNTMKN